MNERYARQFKRRWAENDRFWMRFGEKPEFTNKTVLDFGCGLGSTAIKIAEEGAAKVIGLDINDERIAFAQANLEQNYAHAQDRVTFLADSLANYAPEAEFDLVITKNTFEHVIALDQELHEIAQRLKPGGRLYAGFGPLYYSPFGFHAGLDKGTRTSIPWSHIVMGDTWVINRWSRATGKTASSIYELGNNKLRPADYRQILAGSGLEIARIRYNRPRNTTLLVASVAALFSLLRRLPLLEDYFTINIYCILEKPRA